jgi:hypothetical protein
MHATLIQSARQELEKSRHFQSEGFPGKSRVSARRSAGMAIQLYLSASSILVTSSNAYDLLLFLQTLPDLPAEIKQACHVLTLRVDESFNLPPGSDPILAAETIINWIITIYPESERKND